MKHRTIVTEISDANGALDHDAKINDYIDILESVGKTMIIVKSFGLPASEGHNDLICTTIISR